MPADCTDSISVLAPSIARLAAENAALKARCKVLEEALKPFCFGNATIERILFLGMDDTTIGTQTISLGILRAARKALDNG